LPDSKYVNVSGKQLGSIAFTLASLFKDCEATTNLLCLVTDTNNFTFYNPKAVDILAVSRLIKGTIYGEKTEIINPWGSVNPSSPPPTPLLQTDN